MSLQPAQPAKPMSFLFATWEGGGSVAPALTVAARLVAHGHRVRVMSDACNRDEVTATGAGFIAWTRAPSRPDRSRDSDLMRDWEAATPAEGIARAIDTIWAGPARAYAEDVIEALRREPADLVVSSEMLFGVMIGCEAIGQRLALLTANISLFPIPGVPPVGPGLLPAANEAEAALHREITAANLAMFNRGLGAVNAARGHFGLAPLACVTQQLHAAERTLLGTSAAFDFAPPSLPPHIRYVGPQLGDPGWAAPYRSPWPEGSSRPLLLAAFSTTFQDHVGTLQAVIDGAAALPVRLMVTLGETIAPRELEPAPNTRLVHSAPHGSVMPDVALVITHGGHGTVTRALVHEKPMLLVPHGRDQADNAARVVARGAGIALRPDASPAEFREAIEALLGDPGYAEAARALGRKVGEDMRRSPVVEELEALAACRCCAEGIAA